MLRKLFFLFSLLTIIAGTKITAQEEDTLATGDEHRWKWNWDWEDEWWQWRTGKPSIEITYGLGQPKHNKLTSKLANIGLAEIKLGYVSMEKSEDDDNVFEFDERFAFFSKLSTSLQSDKANYNELPSELLRFGLGKRSGYGYDFKNLRILPYTENAAVWSKLDMKDYPVTILALIYPNNALDDTEILNRFDKEIRFGTLTEGGVRVELGKTVSLNAGYEAAVIFPRHLFWKHLVSFAIESAGINALDNFVDEVFDSSPIAAPIVNFVLKNGFSYAFYTLKKERMNWPFKTEAPLTFETFKFGMTFTF
jgi:hypothetical protein